MSRAYEGCDQCWFDYHARPDPEPFTFEYGRRFRGFYVKPVGAPCPRCGYDGPQGVLPDNGPEWSRLYASHEGMPSFAFNARGQELTPRPDAVPARVVVIRGKPSERAAPDLSGTPLGRALGRFAPRRPSPFPASEPTKQCNSNSTSSSRSGPRRRGFAANQQQEPTLKGEG